MNNYLQAPDLIVTSVAILNRGAIGKPGNVQVVIQNVGNGPVTEEFWVDLYLNPHTVPTAVNQTWEMVGTQGAAWGILADALPLNPGESLTLTVTSPYFVSSSSQISWPLAATAQIYVQVDSNNPGSAYGAVREYHEINGDPYNNIFGPN